MTQSNPLQRYIPEILSEAKKKLPSFKPKWGTNIAHVTQQPPLYAKPSVQNMPELEAELIQILGLDFAGDFRPIKEARWDGKYDVRIAYKLTSSTKTGNATDVMGMLVNDIRPSLVALRDRINDTIDRIPTRINATS